MEWPNHPRGFAERDPQRVALVMYDTGERLTYGELAERSARAANLFAALGVREGDTVAFLLENHIRYPELLWAAKDSGLRYVAISNHLNAGDAAYILADSEARLLVTSHAMRAVAGEAVAQLETPPPLLMMDGAVAPFASYEALLAEQSDRPPEGRRRGASMLYSSGTTGRPKGIRTALSDAAPTDPPSRFAMMLKQYGFGEDTVFLNPAPFYHAGPLRFMMTTMRCGGRVLGFREFRAETVLEGLSVHAVTHGFLVPTMFSRMLAAGAELRAAVRTEAMRHMIHAAAPCPAEVKRAMIEWWGPVIDELYSGTEAIGHTFINSHEWLLHPGSVGRPASNCRIRIVGENGEILPANVPGRIMMANGLDVAYHGAAANGQFKDAEGFASLGDIGYLDDEGYLYLTDRESHMIIVGGVNIYPQEAEAVIGEHPLVADVAVIGVPDADMGEQVKAVIEPKEWPADPEAAGREVIDFCRARLSLHKCPRSVDFVRGLPRTPMGKLLKKDIRQSYWASQGRLI